MKRLSLFFGAARVPLDFLMTVLAFIAAYQLRLITEPIKGIAKPIDYSVLPTLTEYLEFSVGTAIALIVIFSIGKIYILKTSFNFSSEIKKVISLWLVWAMFMISYFFFTRTFPFSRLAIFYSWGLTLVFILIGRGILRIIQKILQKKGIGKIRLLFIGNNNLTKELYQHLKDDSSHQIIGVVGKDIKASIPYLGSVGQLEYVIKKYKIDEVIQTEPNLKEITNEDILELCDLNHLNYRFTPDLVDVRRTNISIETLGTIPVINIKPTPLDGWGKVTKRIIDISGASIGLIILSPLLLITAIAIKIDSKGPILFTKLDNGKPVKRVGQGGKTFKFYKFRSMHPNTHSKRYTDLSEKNTRTDGPLVKIKNDPRVTRVGRFIRKYSIDELPQLANVLIGNMSLVGPRPHLPEEVAKYKNHHRFVLTIKPGLAGLPQVSGRSDLSFEDEVKLDRYYIENWSIFLDLKLILKTILVIIKGHEE